MCIVMQFRKVNQQNALEKINDLIKYFFVFYMFRTFYFHLQKDYILHALLYGIFSTHLCRQANWLNICSSTFFNPLGSSVLIISVGYRISYYSEY